MTQEFLSSREKIDPNKVTKLESLVIGELKEQIGGVNYRVFLNLFLEEDSNAGDRFRTVTKKEMINVCEENGVDDLFKLSPAAQREVVEEVYKQVFAARVKAFMAEKH